MRHQVYLVRHGQSQWNRLRVTQGQVSHPPLTEVGRRQASAAAAAIAADLAAAGPAARADRILSSDLVRAQETAAILAESLTAPVDLDPRLREQSLGRAEGLPYEEAWRLVEDHDWSDPTVPVLGGESVDEVARRMREVLADLDRSVVNVLVSHGDAVRALLGGHGAGSDSGEGAPQWLEIPLGAVARIDEFDAVTWLDCDRAAGRSALDP